jgi:16S rRNA (uracil1498-N3)-methyltransferase
LISFQLCFCTSTIVILKNPEDVEAFPGMTRKCFFSETVDPSEEFITLSAQAAHHLDHVLRTRPGELVEVRDGKGNGWLGEIVSTKGGEIRVRIGEKQEGDSESPLELTLALAFSRAERMELVLRQITEMGAHRFVAFRAQRSQYSLSGSQMENKVERWNKIAQSALCQCGRFRVPEIRILTGVPECIADVQTRGESGSETLKIIAYEEDQKQNLLDVWRLHPECRRVFIVVGPEGGWTHGEVDQFTRTGFHPVHLGPRILRFETAAVSLIASAQLLWGDFGRSF